MWHRKPAVAGSFYPSGTRELSGMVEEYLKAAGKAQEKGEILGVISPHAGYVYSGPIAAYSYRELADRGIELVVGIAPSHRARFDGASVIPEGLYQTPLGDVPIDGEICQALSREENFGFIKDVHQFEHSFEVQVPFLQKVLGTFSLVPIIIGTTELAVCRRVADAIAGQLSRETRKYVIVISTDLSHYHSYDEAVRLDHVFIDGLKTMDESRIAEICDRRKAEACGQGAVLAGLMACKRLGAGRLEILRYGNSGDTAGPKDQVVGYLSAAICK